MEITLLLCGLAVGVIACTWVADRVDVPAPFLLILVGVVASYVPMVPEVELSEDVVLFGLLPPLLYAAAQGTSLVDFKANRRAILLLSVGLVAFTTFGVGLVAHLLLPGVSWAIALAIGAVVAPPDAVAATAIGRRIGLPRRIVTILEGESLLNDATALVALGTALAVAEGSGFEPLHVGLDFLLAAGGGVAVGFVFFLLVAKLRRHLTDPVLDSGLSLVVPFAAYVAAEQVHASGVIAVVVAGLLLGHKAPILQTAQSRIAERLNWRTIAFVLENAVFLLIGLQARTIVEGAGEGDLSWGRIIGICAATLAACVVLRLAWVFPARYLIVRPGPDPVTGRKPPWTSTFVLGWAGMRGVVTLAAAFVIPEDTPHREVLLLMAFTVVAGTLFIQGMSLPWVARRLRVPAPDPAEDALARATLLQQASKAALHRLDELEYDDSARRGRADPAAARPAQLRGLGAARHQLRAGVAQRPLRPGPAGDARCRAGAGAGDPQRRHRRLRGGRRRPGAARRRGVDARRRDRGATQRAGDRVGAPHRRQLRRPRALPGDRDRAGPGLPALPRRGVPVGLAAPVSRVRRRRLLRLLGDAARHQALPRDDPPGDGVRRARRGLALVLPAPQDRLSRDVPSATRSLVRLSVVHLSVEIVIDND